MSSGKNQIFLRFCQSNLMGFLRLNLAQFTKSLSLGHLLKDFFSSA